MTYTLIANSNTVIRDADGAFIPDDAGNVDWQAYQAWLAVPNTPTPAASATVSQQATAALAAGITLTCTGNSALNGLYACDNTTLSRITSLVLIPPIAFVYPTMAGVNKTFTSTQFSNFAAAVGGYNNALNVIVTANSGSLPAATATIP
jgi:hypothetical protein